MAVTLSELSALSNFEAEFEQSLQAELEEPNYCTFEEEFEQSLQAELEESLNKMSPHRTAATDDLFDDSAASTELQSRATSDLDSDEDSVAEACFGASETLIIFDWDDTLLCSSWLRQQGLDLSDNALIAPEQRELLGQLAVSASEVLRRAAKVGEVILVTNAERGWVEMSCTKFLPSLAPLLASFTVISARSTYEPQGFPNPFDWKRFEFGTQIDAFCKHAGHSARRNLVSVGDSAHEREALIRATELHPTCCVKSVKFAERPDLEQLLKEHELIIGCLRDIVQHDGNLDLCIQ